MSLPVSTEIGTQSFAQISSLRQNRVHCTEWTNNCICGCCAQINTLTETAIYNLNYTLSLHDSIQLNIVIQSRNTVYHFWSYWDNCGYVREWTVEDLFDRPSKRVRWPEKVRKAEKYYTSRQKCSSSSQFLILCHWFTQPASEGGGVCGL